jgi:hypothetical protein
MVLAAGNALASTTTGPTGMTPAVAVEIAPADPDTGDPLVTCTAYFETTRCAREES